MKIPYVNEAKTGVVVWLANAVASIVLLLFVILLGIVGITLGGSTQIANGSFSTMDPTSLLAIGIVSLIAFVIVFYATLVVRGIAFNWVKKFLKGWA